MPRPMASTKTTKPAAKAPRKPAAKASEAAEGRRKSKLTQAGEEGSRLARRSVLLATCEAADWNLARVAEVLVMASHADVIRALKELAPEEYAAAQASGAVAKRR